MSTEMEKLARRVNEERDRKEEQAAHDALNEEEREMAGVIGLSAADYLAGKQPNASDQRIASLGDDPRDAIAKEFGVSREEYDKWGDRDQEQKLAGELAAKGT